MPDFYGRWQDFPELVDHLERLRTWVEVFGVVEELGATSHGKLPKTIAKSKEQIQGDIWTIFFDGQICKLKLGIFESLDTLSFLVTRTRFSEQTQISDSEIGLDVILEIDCDIDHEEFGIDEEDCDCQGGVPLVFNYEDYSETDKNMLFPTGSYFTRRAS